jgi:hypothetical protein
MKSKLITILFVFLAHILFSQTIIPNGMEVSGTWKKSKSPYIIEGEAIVPKGKTLKIKKGVEIKFKTGTDKDYRLNGVLNRNFNTGFLRVNGKIIAEGSKNDRILFTQNGQGTWGNVFIDSRSAGILFKYCVFEGGYFIRGITETDNATGALSFYNATGMVEYCTFRNNGWTALNCKLNAAPVFKNVTIVGNNYGVECNSNSSPKIVNAIIWNNTTAFYINGDAQPQFSFSLIQGYSMDALYDKGSNIFGRDPGFKNAGKNDFSLTSVSPCRESGDGGVDMGAE